MLRNEKKYFELIDNGDRTCQNFWNIVIAVEGKFITMNVYITKEKKVFC